MLLSLAILLQVYLIEGTNISPSPTRPVSIIIGAGPVGLSAALVLQKRGWKATVIERSKDILMDNSKAYQYLLDGRGQRITDYLNITWRVATNSISTNQPDVSPRLTEILVSGEIRQTPFPAIPSAAGVPKYWIPRSQMLSVLLQSIETANFVHSDNPIKIIPDCNCVGLHISPSDKQINVLAINCNNDSVTLQADLVLACDGIHSTVRSALCNTPDGYKYSLTVTSSDAAGLQYKMLTVKNGSMGVDDSAFCAVRGTGCTPLTRLQLGLLPVAKGLRRTANIIALPGHQVWKANTIGALQEYLMRMFPQLQPLNRYFTDEVWYSVVFTAQSHHPFVLTGAVWLYQQTGWFVSQASMCKLSGLRATFSGRGGVAR
jgi:kynurenine 3-monooxygenase